MELDKPLQELQRSIIKETLEAIDDIYVNDKKRQETYHIERRNEPNTILTTCGDVTYKRTYFKLTEKSEEEEICICQLKKGLSIAIYNDLTSTSSTSSKKCREGFPSTKILAASDNV